MSSEYHPWSSGSAAWWWQVGVVSVALLGQTLWVGSQIGTVKNTVDTDSRRIEQIEREGSPALAALRVQLANDERRLLEDDKLLNEQLRALNSEGVSHVERLKAAAQELDRLQRSIDAIHTVNANLQQRVASLEAQEAALHGMARRDGSRDGPH